MGTVVTRAMLDECYYPARCFRLFVPAWAIAIPQSAAACERHQNARGRYLFPNLCPQHNRPEVAHAYRRLLAELRLSPQARQPVREQMSFAHQKTTCCPEHAHREPPTL